MERPTLAVERSARRRRADSETALNISRFALFAGLTAAALATAGMVVLLLTGPLAGSAPSTFLFAFSYSWLAGLIVGVPPLLRMSRRDTLTWLTASGIGAMAAAFPGLLFLLLIANCGNNAVVWGITMCADGTRLGTAWLYSGFLLAVLAGLGAAAGIIGFGVYRILAAFLKDSA